MGLFDDVTDDRSDPGSPYRRRDPVKLVRESEATPPGRVSRLKSLLWTLWYWITGKYNL
jgi:hypothetical protein